MKSASKNTAGIRTSHFANTVLFLTEVLKLEIAHDEKEFAQLKLPSGQILKVLGSKNLWHPFTIPPYWEVILADLRRSEEQS